MEGAPDSALPLAAQTSLISSVTQTSVHTKLCYKPRDRGKTPAFLSNLGKPTLRGIRKCPQCGVYNGTRGLSCKNNACGVIFRGGAQRAGRGSKRAASEVVRVVTDGGEGGATGPQVFSIRQRGRGSEQRGFVELVLADTAIATSNGTLLTRVNLGRCLVSSCRHGDKAPAAVEDGRQPLAQMSESPCAHVKQAMECKAQATPLPLKSSVLEALPSAQAKEELWRLATESPGPLVQRVSRETMVVKCHPGEAHPLGFLHLTLLLGASGTGGRGEGALFRCGCQTPRAREKAGLKPTTGSDQAGRREPDPALLSSPPSSGDSPLPVEPCLHLCACVCAFNSDEKLASEFAIFLKYYSNGLQESTDTSVLCASDSQKPTNAQKSRRLKAEEPTAVLSACSPALACKDGSGPALSPRKASHRKHPPPTGLSNPGSGQQQDGAHVSLAFQQWLASVTERIHQTMHFQFDGKPEPLVFHIPQAFFNALQHRLSLGSKKRRLPNSSTTFVRRDALPLGSFSKYTWHITNPMQVKRIFDTPELPLELTQSFVRNSDGSYSPFHWPELTHETAPPLGSQGRTDRPPAIRPLELRTFLKVGVFSPEQREPVPFVIEWIPDILPRSQVGELRIRFEYGRQLAGQPSYGEAAVPAGVDRTAQAPTEETGQGQPVATATASRHLVP